MHLQVQTNSDVLERLEPLLKKHNIDVFQGFDVTDDGEVPRNYVEAWEDDFNNFLIELDAIHQEQNNQLKQ